MMYRLLAILIGGLLVLVLEHPHSHALNFPTLVGHRGIGDPWTAELGIPENSIKAIQWAAANHADIVEGDVQVSGKDGDGSRTMYMMHDDLLERTTNGSGDTNSRPWSYVNDLWLEIPRDLDGNGNYDNTDQRVPSFRRWLAAAKATGKLVFLELKGDLWTEGQTRKAVDEVKSQGMIDKVIFAGNATKLGYVKKYGGSKRSYSVNGYPSITTVKGQVGSSGYATIQLSIAEDNPAYVKNLQASGVKVFVWTLDKEDHYRRAAVVADFYGWMCDNTADAHRWLEENGA